MKRVLSVTFVSLLLAFSAVVVAQTRSTAPTTAPTIAPTGGGAGEGTGAVQERAVDPRATSGEARQPERNEGSEDDVNDGDDNSIYGTGGTP